jgi:hypothetical protein
MKNSEPEKRISIQKSPLDTILGDKILNVETGKLRKDNFKSLLKIRKDQLKIKSALYNLKQLDHHHFVLSQKQKYTDARNFSILVKTNDSFISDYVVFNDFLISDVKRDAASWILLLSDFHQTNNYWKSEQQIKIVKLDSRLKELWSFSKNSAFPLACQSLTINPDNYSFKIEVITSCHICFSLAELLLTKDGQFSSVRTIGTQNSYKLTDEELQQIFIDN